MNKVSKHLPWLILLLASFSIFCFSACGSKANPTGGKADTSKIRVLATIPEEFGEISEQQIELTFDKSVDRATFLTGYYIYPPIQNRKINYESNVITIRFLEALEKDTNYYLTLTTRIKDSRGNALDQPQTLIYRHGVLQNNRISGNISYEKAEDNGLPVLINLVSQDSLPVLAKNVKGSSYAIEALNPISYILRAYIDKNLNGRYDPDQEPYQETSVPESPVSTVNLSMAYADTVKPAIKSVQAVSNREYIIILNKPVVKFSTVNVRDITHKDNIRVFTINHELDKIDLLTAPTDSAELEFRVTGLLDNKDNRTPDSELNISASTKADHISPTVVAVNPRNGSTINDLQPLLEVTFSEVIPAADFQADLIQVESGNLAQWHLVKANSTVYQIKPDADLDNMKTYQFMVKTSTTDISGNKLKEPFKLTFLPLIRATQPPAGK